MEEQQKKEKMSLFSYERIIIRLIVTSICIVATCLIWAKNYTQMQPTDYVTFENYWLSCAYVVTLLITGLLFAKIYFSEKKEPNAKNIKRAGFFSFILCLLFVTLLACSLIQISSDHPFFIWAPLCVAFFVCLNDIFLWKAGLSGLKKPRTWLPFDLAIISGIVAVILIRSYLPGMAENEISRLFSGGATSFQLIMANIVFDPRNYQ